MTNDGLDISSNIGLTRASLTSHFNKVVFVKAMAWKCAERGYRQARDRVKAGGTNATAMPDPGVCVHTVVNEPPEVTPDVSGGEKGGLISP